MVVTSGGTAILIAVAAGLWLLYLVPMWRRRTEYLATERNAIRLQQTLRIMAQTAEVPAEVRAELTARDVAAQQRSLAARQREEAAIARAREAAAQRALRARLAETAPGLVAEVDASRLGQRRLRRSRAVTSLLSLLSIVGIVVALVAGAWAWAGFAAFVTISGMALLTGLARAQRRRTEPVAGVAASQFVDLAPPVRRAPPVVRREWTPVPLPKPSYLSAPVIPAGAAAPALDHAAALAAAAAEAERAQRAASVAASVAAASGATDEHRRAASTTSEWKAEQPERPAASRFDRMGLVDQLPTRPPDLDEVLRRRRAAS
ncbi:MAG: hypothetical protein Q7J04_08580 [Microcella sp.]|nr:hypothetical protein [Microcella sp.]